MYDFARGDFELRTPEGRSGFLCLLGVVAMLFAPLVARSQVTHDVAFEVASIRIVQPYSEEELRRGLGNAPFSKFPSNRFTARHASLKLLIAFAYGVDQRRIENDPQWMDEQHYDVEAKVDGDRELTYEQMKPLLQRLLEDRLHLAVHRISKTQSGYALVVAKNGPKLVKSKGPTETGGYLMADRMHFRDISMLSLAAMLSHPVGEPISDKTGIEGTYDIDLSFAPANDPNSKLPDIFTAVQEQLGLKLVSAKVPVEFLVIDGAERTPAEN